MLGFGSKSAPMAKVLDFGTKKISKGGGGFSGGGDRKTINFENQNVSRSRFF